MSNHNHPFYNPQLSYEDNYKKGPFGVFTKKPDTSSLLQNPVHFLGCNVNLPFGIPAGPLLNGKYVKAALDWEYDICVYKTVRTKKYKCHPLPNVLAVHPDHKLSANIDTVLADQNYDLPISITNSFGVPSFDPDVWQPDMEEAVNYAKPGQVIIGSFQGTLGATSHIEKDYAEAARLIDETGAPLLEANLSCPNEGVNNLLCFDINKVERIVHAIKNTVPDKPLILKLAYFKDNTLLYSFLERLAPIVNGFCAINTLSIRPINAHGECALGKDRPIGGVCGNAIRWAGEEMVSRLYEWRANHNENFILLVLVGSTLLNITIPIVL